MSWKDKIKCPVCPQKTLVVGLRNHIAGKAKSELFRWYFDRTEPTPHLKYFEKNAIIETIEVKTLKLK